MKKSNVKYSDILSFDIIEKNYNTIVKNTKHKMKIVKFDMFKSSNINLLYKVLKERKYKHGEYNIFLIKDPKYRIVMSESIFDKITNHIVSEAFLKPAIYPKLIDENVATRVGKGTNEAIKLCRKYFTRMSTKYKNFYILKFDIKKYFYNIDHMVLKDMLKQIYRDEFVLRILFEIIDSTDHSYINDNIDRCINREIKRMKNNERLDELLQIPHYKVGKGLGIGSLSNQIFAVFYLNGLDHYIKETLDIKEYVRFMDDGIIFSNSYDKLKLVLDKITNYLKTLKLELNDKTVIHSCREGFDFVGYRFIYKNGKMIIRIKKNTKNNMKRKFKNLRKYNYEKYERVKASYKGLVSYSNINSLYNKYFRS